MLTTSVTPRFGYPYEEFAEHVKAMLTVREWEYTSRFGHVGSVQTSRANNARVVDYFADTYEDQKEAVHKAEVFLCIYDYIGRHAELFARKDLLEEIQPGHFAVDPVLLRAVHHAWTSGSIAAGINPKKVVSLARALKDLAQAT